MGYKSVSLTSEVYALLKEKKSNEESISDFIKRLLEKPNITELIELAGIWSDIPNEEVEALKHDARGS